MRFSEDFIELEVGIKTTVGVVNPTSRLFLMPTTPSKETAANPNKYHFQTGSKLN